MKIEIFCFDSQNKKSPNIMEEVHFVKFESRKPAAKTIAKKERRFLSFKGGRAAIVSLETLKDGSTFVILEEPAQINRMCGPTQPSSHYIVYKDGTFEVSPDRCFRAALGETYVKKITDFLSREIRRDIFSRDQFGSWTKVEIE